MDDLISKLSKIRSNYNCFDEDEEPYYRALSDAIRILSQLADGDTISRQAAVELVMKYCPDDDGAVQCDGDIRELLDELENLLSAQHVSDWISVDDRLPYAEYGESPTVYCYCQDVVRGGRWSEMLYYNGGVWCKPTGETFDYKVLAWYPLPKKPYREKKV